MKKNGSIERGGLLIWAESFKDFIFRKTGYIVISPINAPKLELKASEEVVEIVEFDKRHDAAVKALIDLRGHEYSAGGSLRIAFIPSKQLN